MAKPDFAEVEKKLRRRKCPVVLADVRYTYIGGWGDDCIREIKIKLTSPPKDLAELIYRLLCKHEGSAMLIKNGKRYQCENGRQRSLLDLYTITLTYAPETTYKEVYDVVEKLKHGPCIDGVVKNPLIRSHYCTTTNRVVHNGNSLATTADKIREMIGKRNIIFK